MKNMTPQHHIEAIGASLLKIEQMAQQIKRLSLGLNAAMREHHNLLDRAQRAYCQQPSSASIVPFSGGTNKPDPNDEKPGG